MFKDALKILDEISIINKEKKSGNNKNLLKLYSLVYVKQYLYHTIYYLINNEEEINSILNIINSINDIKNKAFSRVIKIYILKLIFNFKKCNYEEFKNYKFEEKGINFLKEFEDKAPMIDNILPSETISIKDYKEILNAFVKISDFNSNNKDFEVLLDKYDFDLFLLLALNKYISNLALQDNDKKELYINYGNFFKLILNNKNYDKNLKELLFLFFDLNFFKNNIKPKISMENGMIKTQLFESILYGFRFCANSLNLKEFQKKKEDSLLFPSLLSDRCQKAIENSFIPGIDNKEDFHVSQLYLIKNHHEKYPDDVGCYVCSCGFYYNVSPPGFPSSQASFNCPNCGQKLGYEPKVIKDRGSPNHGMVIRNGHYRIFKNIEQKNAQMAKWGEIDENIPNIILDDYIKDVIEPIRLGNTILGFNVIDKEFFEKKDKKIRKLSNIGYRLLNFIAYSHLYYSYCIGKLTEQDLNKYLIKDCNILQIIEINWNLLKEALNEVNINSIQIFINAIFKDLIKLIKVYKISKEKKNLETFEKAAENLISKTIKNYSKYSEEYIKNQDIDINNLKSLVSEIVSPGSGSYSEEEYPMFKYFLYTEYKNKQDFINKMINKEKYPLINQFISNYQNLKKLKYLPAFNDFINYMLKNYSFRISRKEAKNRSLENEEIVKEKDFSFKYKNFIDAWEHIKLDAVKYKCREDMEVKNEFTLKDKLCNFLNDDKELKNGMYLASACQNFIQWQNGFIREIIESYKNGGILNKYINSNNLLKNVPVQEAKPEQIIIIEEKFKKNGDNYTDFNDLFYALSERKIFDDNGKINYSNYNTFNYDYEKIEEELGKIILSDTCLFDNENELNFMIYWGEEFRGKNYSIIYDLIEKYPQNDLEKYEKEEVIKYITNINKDSQDKNKNPYEFKNFYTSFQLLFQFLKTATEVKKDETICNIIKGNLEKLKLSDDFKHFFNNEGKNFTLNKLYNLFSIFEHLISKDLFEMLQPDFKIQIPEETKNKIIEKILTNKNTNDVITTKDLAAAIRRLITRYLIGENETIYINKVMNWHYT